MDDLWTMTLLGQEEPSLWRLLGPLLTVVAVVVYGWLNEKAKQKERQQPAEDDARRQGVDEDSVSQAQPAGPGQAQRAPLPQARDQQRPGVAPSIHRYEPRIPSAPGRAAEPSRAQTRQRELIITADDLSDEVAQRQFQREQQPRLRDEAIRQARALQAERREEAARKAETVRRKTIELKPFDKLSHFQIAPGRELFKARTALLAPGQTISRPQIRRAIVWAEILGAPRALRPYEEVF